MFVMARLRGERTDSMRGSLRAGPHGWDGDQVADELAAVLAARRAGERAVLPFHEAPSGPRPSRETHAGAG